MVSADFGDVRCIGVTIHEIFRTQRVSPTNTSLASCSARRPTPLLLTNTIHFPNVPRRHVATIILTLFPYSIGYRLS
jgi:hypothetical protein